MIMETLKVQRAGLGANSGELVAVVWNTKQAKEAIELGLPKVLCIKVPRCQYALSMQDADLFFKVEM